MSYNGTTDPIVLLHDKKNEVSTVILSIIGGVSLMAVVTRLLYRYADFKKTPWYALATVWLNWFAAVCLVLLIPVDVSSSIHEDCLQQLVNTTYSNQTHGIFHTNETTTITIVDGCDEPWVHVSREGLIIIWKIIYWFTFIMCWAVVPLMQSYVVAAHFHWYQRVLRAFFENLVLYGVGLVVGIGLAIWLILTEKLDEAGLVGIAMAASNAYGLLIVILLLGYGLTELPRKIWRKANRQATMRYYQFHAFLYMESYQEAKKELETTLKLIKKYDESIPETDPMRKYFRVILSKVPMEYKDIPKGAGDVKTTYKDYVTLHSRLINATHEVLATRCLYEDLLRRAFNLEDVMKAKENRTKVVEWTFKKKKVNALTPFMSKIEWYWKVFAEPWALRLGCGICILMGIIIVWSETLFSVKKVKLSLLYWIVQGPKSPPFVLLWFLVFAPMAYISLCAYWSLFRLRIFKYYRLLPHHNSDANSLLFNAYYLSRIIAPMAYNFLLLINDNVSSFSTVMGVADVTPLLGSFFNVYFPIVLILFCIANTFNLYTRFVEFFSQAVSCCLKVKVNNFEFDDDFYDERLDKGKEIIAQEKEFKISRNALSLDLGIDLLKYTPKKAEKQTSSKWSARLAGMLSSKSKPKNDSLEMVERGRV